MLTDYIIRLALAGLLGAIIGFEREFRSKEAGLRTHFLVAAGSALMMIVSKYGFSDMLGDQDVALDPSRIAAQVVSGIGFLGAGMIIIQRQSVRGLTTAAGMWATSGIGLTIGAGLYWVGICAAILVLIGLEILSRIFKNDFSKVITLEIETLSKATLNNVMSLLKDFDVDIVGYSYSKHEEQDSILYSYVITGRLKKRRDELTLLTALNELEETVSLRIL
ncbi:hypothetical protein A374_19315 [Fictibacillus macauensis ZFHKF-1]|uniref:MgtC/SapB/SrpB/YhiD N-terminal domain-containing protein n=1 Tax=Fictibacillus macauensis ZFHKF-1 TaxID=1196324 RepID=I8IW36_9BACL|nr:hypothetical protein A374_19315 [Fictibacillus macauensis ZFHKF-1]